MKWFMHCLRNYATFTGRASRQEYWWFYLVVVVLGLGLNFIGSTVVAQALQSIWALGLLLPHLAVASRRLHDTGHSFWWFGVWAAFVIPLGLFLARAQMGATTTSVWLFLYLLAFIAYSIYVLILLCKQGDSGPNPYGDPAPTSPN
jgi:uncharacterized membrane protein YhaH (DUF805 family)